MNRVIGTNISGKFGTAKLVLNIVMSEIAALAAAYLSLQSQYCFLKDGMTKKAFQNGSPEHKRSVEPTNFNKTLF